MSILDKVGSVGDELALRQYFLTLRSVKVLDDHTHPDYVFLILELSARERRSPVTFTLDACYLSGTGSGAPVNLKGWKRRYFDFNAIRNHESPKATGVVIFETLKRNRKFKFEVVEKDDMGSTRWAVWKFTLPH